MKLSGRNINMQYTPLHIGGNLLITGGPAAQFYDGNSFYPNREGTPSSPILIEHQLSVVDPDGILTEFEFSTKFYENDALITAATSGYTLIGSNSVRVEKNIPASTSVVLKAVSELLDSRSGKVYRREDIRYLRTILKSEAPYQLELNQRGLIYFDAYRNPNTTTDLYLTLKKGGDLIQGLVAKGYEVKWLNSAGLDIEENELYVDTIPAGREGILVDKTYIDKELIKCEVWKDGELLAYDTATFVRKFNSFRADIRIPELPLHPGVEFLNCRIDLADHLGNIDVDAAFLVTWMVSEGGVDRQVATGADVQIPVSSINLKAANLSIYPDVKRREAYAALTTIDGGEEALLVDDDDNVLVVETYGD